jgi:lipopolysaccharide cholinephosphotransferase
MEIVTKLRLVQLLCLKCLVDTTNVCNKLNIDYYLIAGTLLGAVRNKGFIPWDSDIDICMFRKDYEHFIKNAPELLNEDYFIQNDISDPLNNTFFTKVRIRGTKFREKRNKALGGEHGIYIDIFPIDEIEEYPTKSKFYLLKIVRILIRLKAFKNGKHFSASLTRSIYSYILFCFFFWIPIKWINISIEKYFRRENGREFDLVTNYNSKYGILKQTMNKSIYGKPQSIIFENHLFKIPQKYKLWLTNIYGNYMMKPSKIPNLSKVLNPYYIDYGKYKNLLDENEDSVYKTLGL